MTEALRASNVPEIERYELGSLIGRGSMGAVYEATDADGRVVALKILHAEVAEHEMALTRFEREVELARRIEHPAVPEIFDWGQLPDGRLFLAMERLYGDSLEGWWETPGRPRALAMELLLEALGPLAVAHRLGIVHRDLKPENVFVLDRHDRGRVRLLDFGIARDIDEHAKSKTATGVAVGTPVYMSPEQATKPRLASQPTDVWSFGVMMYEALCGELPFDGDTPHAVIIAVATEAHVPLAERAPELHPDLLALVERCLLKDPSRRPRDAGELEALLGALLARPEVVNTIDGFAATPPFRLSSRPTSGDAAPIELRVRADETLDEGSATPSSSGLRRIDLPQRSWAPIAAIVLLAIGGLGAWAWTRASEGATAPASSVPSVASSSDSSEEPIVAAERSGGPATEEPPPPADAPEPTDDGEERRDAFDDGPGPAPEVSVRRATSMARGREVAPSVESDVEREEVGEVDATDDVASATPSVPEDTIVAPSVPSVDTPSASAPTAAAANAPSADNPSAPSASAPTTEPSTPMTRTVRRVVRRPATNTPTRPGFVTF
ncbi:MAG: serine/threonine protein kinase [Myxococcota bacterium]|nr:serine/threonine protein kinase [Myxococcota bacterium]